MREANITNVKIGDKVVLKNPENFRFPFLIYLDKNVVYGIIERIENASRPPIVDWVNHKGLVVDRDYCNLRVGSSDFYFYE